MRMQTYSPFEWFNKAKSSPLPRKFVNKIICYKCGLMA